MKLSTRFTIIAVVCWLAGAAIFALDLLSTLIGIITISFLRPLLLKKFLIRIKIRRVKQTSNAIIRMIGIGQSAKPLGCGQRSDNDQANYSISSVKALLVVNRQIRVPL